MKRKENSNASSSWLRIVGMVLAVVLGLAVVGLVGFTYLILPKQVAETIITHAKVRAVINWTPKDEGFSYQDVSFKTPDNILISGWYIPSTLKKPLGTVILSHGIFHNRGQVLDRAKFLVKAGYQVLLFDHRGEGLSGESPITGGVLEAGDYVGAVNYLKETHRLVKPLAFLGFSLGAISAIRAAPQCPDVDAVIADSPVPNVKSYIARRSFGKLFTSMPGFFEVYVKDYDAMTGLSLTAAQVDLNPIVQNFNEVPILYITGEQDDLARPAEVRALFNLTQSHHRSLVYIPGAGHEQTYELYPAVYEQAVKGFLAQVREKFPEIKESELLKRVPKRTVVAKK